jgi:riboflavin biosynthesis pyrimidine reductase
MGFAKGWKAFKAAKRKRTRKASPKPRRPAVQTRRRNTKPKGGNSVARRKKNININLLDLGGGIVLADQFLGPGAIDSIVALKMPNLKGLPARLRDPSVQGALVKTGLSIAILKTAFRGFARQVGAIGPVKLKI